MHYLMHFEVVLPKKLFPANFTRKFLGFLVYIQVAPVVVLRQHLVTVGAGDIPGWPPPWMYGIATWNTEITQCNVEITKCNVDITTCNSEILSVM